MKFLLVGHGGFYNRGCEAIILTTLEMLREGFPNSKFIISSFDYENDRLKNLGTDVQFIKHRLSIKRKSFEWLFQQIKRIFFKEYRRNYWKIPYKPISEILDEVDVILSVGGDNYTMDYGYPDYFLGLNRLAKEAGKKMVILGASIGPFPEELETQIAANLKMADLITARESCTVEYLNKIGVRDNVKSVADPAFLLTDDSDNIEGEIPFDEKDFLGFNISPLLKRYKGEEWSKNTIDEVVYFLNKVIDDYKLAVILVPHVTKKDSANNDYIYMKDIYNRLKNTGKIFIASENDDARQMKYIISKCRFFVGARTHSTIAALSSKVPTLSIGYSLKARGINRDIFGCLDYVVDFNKLAYEYLIGKFDNLVNSEAEIRKTLSVRIPVIKKAALDNGLFLREIMNSNSVSMIMPTTAEAEPIKDRKKSVIMSQSG